MTTQTPHKAASVLDQGSAIRAGEELPTGPLLEWLNSEIKLPNGESLSGDMKVTQYSGGASNWTYCLSFDNRDVILRRPPAGTKAKGAHDMGREYSLQDALKPVYSKVPAMLGYTDDESVIGAEFYVMEKINGIIPRKHFPRGVNLSQGQARRLCEVALDELINLHNVDIEAANLSHLGKGAGYAQRQVLGWNKRYTNAKTWNVPSGKKVMRWLEDNLPAKETICMTHNDYRFDNLVLDVNDPTQILAVLDWELATLGDPLMDLGNSLAYWIQADDDFMARSTQLQPTDIPGMMTRQQVIDYYCNKQGVEPKAFAFYEVYGLFRLAGIVQQIYYRYHHKQTHNKAYKNMWTFVHYLLYRCNKITKQQ
ncbi:predicted aminoglycoside phosphotransferase [Glaciecola punicea ACAM 611]|uniref:Predicted aminoglycoside phosphotransferase n=1 Tax=Glaciecola punicea ACAM 611 TaxID=1121923 RepID=H5TB02_9ALTE|nr:phosphotransferase family protein [Glaciecola punicea]OFA32498.1 aminoglycoside phosphotransferase [Glaciecola punicea]GAB55479.1 predicted aminoglycoside phosphotransferase [Glaciecola punicea ACAM 611]